MTLTSRVQRTPNLSEKLGSLRESKRVCLPIDQEEYQHIVGDQEAYCAYLDGCIRRHPELFPAGLCRGYQLHTFCEDSVKMPDVLIRRICLHARDERGRVQVFQVVPSFVLPYRTGTVGEVEKPLFLHYKFGVPFWALSYVFGRDGSYWYRVSQQLGHPSLVGTTVKHASKLPEHLLADPEGPSEAYEKHSRIVGNKAYLACTVAEECVLGASLSLSASEEELTEAYHDFKEEACQLDPDYQPKTVNADGWFATQAAWQSLFPGIVVILCFLHAFLKIRDRAKRLFAVFPEVAQKVWDAYQQTGGCRRTSTMLDRHLDALDRYLYGLRYFHGHLASAQLSVRGWALAHNFMPYCPRAEPSKQFVSPAHRLNGFVYHQNWLENLFVSASLGGRKC